MVWHCKKESYHHANGYDLCEGCADKLCFSFFPSQIVYALFLFYLNRQLEYKEMGSLESLERDERYPIRVTLQYYKSTDNGVVTEDIMDAIEEMLKKSQKHADFIGSLVNETDPKRPTEWVPEEKKEVTPEPPEMAGKSEILRKCLKELNLGSEYLEKFISEEVDDEVFVSMGKDDLKEIFGKMGPRLKVWKWLEGWNKTASAEMPEKKEKEKEKEKPLWKEGKPLDVPNIPWTFPPVEGVDISNVGHGATLTGRTINFSFPNPGYKILRTYVEKDTWHIVMQLPNPGGIYPCVMKYWKGEIPKEAKRAVVDEIAWNVNL